MNFYEDDMTSSFLRRAAMGMSRQTFDEYYRCYPVVMLPGPERENVNHGGKVIMPPSALDKLTRLHITYPMLFELINGKDEKTTHAGVLEFIAEEGKIYLPYWMMQTLSLEPGDLIQIKSTDLPPGNFIKLQPQSTSFLDISDPKAVLEYAFRNFSCLTKNDIFTFVYNEQTYEMAVLELKPDTDKHAIVTMETDLEVDFATPIGYEEPKRNTSGTSTPRSIGGVPGGGHIQSQGTMAQAINYSAIAPESTDAAQGAKATSSNFLVGGQRLSAKKGSKVPTPKASTPVAGTSTNASAPPPTVRKTNGPQPLRLPPGKLFFGYELKPLRKKNEQGLPEEEQDQPKPTFQGAGQTLRAGGKRKGEGSDADAKANSKEDKQEKAKPKDSSGSRLGGGRTLKDW